MVSFLSLPFLIRRRIYVLAGLVRFCPIDLNHEGPQKVEYARRCFDYLDEAYDGWRPPIEGPSDFLISTADLLAEYSCFYRSKRFQGHAPFPGPDGLDCVCGPLPRGLLLVCRAIHIEVVTILYAENQFKISRSGPGGLKALSQLSPKALGAMTSLHVGLTACGCVLGQTCSPHEPNPLIYPCFSCHPGCKCGVGSPFFSHNPSMRSLPQEWERLVLVLAAQLTPGRLRLSVVCDTLDHAAAQQILLPLERLPLLKSCAVRLGQQPDHHLRRLAQTTVHQVTGHSAHLRPPFGGTTSLMNSNYRFSAIQALSHLGPLNGWRGRALPGHPAASSWPRDHFLVNHKFRHQALQIFYRSNTFSVETLDAHWDRDMSHHLEHRSALVFLQSIPRDALPHIYSLRIIFPTFHNDGLCPGTPSLTNWTDTLRFIQGHLPLAHLDLALCIAFASQDDGYVTGWEDKEWAFYQRMVAPAVILRGIRNLFAIFPPTGDAPREARNRLRERDLQTRTLGWTSPLTRVTKPREGQGHPEMEEIWDAGPITLGPSGERIWPPW
ncbi:uncharacterized protein A1O5_08181 [Cladophialophora psammophila CBS 110553]|uniref:Uncharacterized protein n=1 Tax=Cladophialophora psammophila CBS 110553 TaxID=1182543 RepID=W9XDA8_9EURO|nr:uncharacterized protein A1O5_08181 [Cladophialophora psammophila CBS 110553]EXJ68389.1 hypothetical protein A1O5_08181 [Cladophialophora psammophila CBS 110553]